MRIVHEAIVGVGSLILDSFGGDPVAQVTVTLPTNHDLAEDFAHVSFDLSQAIEKVRHAKQLELAL